MLVKTMVRVRVRESARAKARARVRAISRATVRARARGRARVRVIRIAKVNVVVRLQVILITIALVSEMCAMRYLVVYASGARGPRSPGFCCCCYCPCRGYNGTDMTPILAAASGLLHVGNAPPCNTSRRWPTARTTNRVGRQQVVRQSGSSSPSFDVPVSNV